MTTEIGLSWEDVLKKINSIYSTQYERKRKITVVSKDLTIDDPMLKLWEIKKSDNTITLVFTWKLGLTLDRWSPILFVSESQYLSMKKVIEKYDKVVHKTFEKYNVVYKTNQQTEFDPDPYEM